MYVTYSGNSVPSVSANISSNLCWGLTTSISNTWHGMKVSVVGVANRVCNAWNSMKKSFDDTYRGATKSARVTWDVIQNPNYKKINKHLRTYEEWLNFFGKIPFVSFISGLVREQLACIEILTGFSFALFHRGLAFSAGTQDIKKKRLQQVKTDMAYCAHGFANIFRAELEQKTFLTNLYVLSLLFGTRIAYDWSGIRVKYPDIPSCLDRIEV